jgi:hypothetical protein
LNIKLFAKDVAREECNKYVVLKKKKLANHNDWYKWFAINSKVFLFSKYGEHTRKATSNWTMDHILP